MDLIKVTPDKEKVKSILEMTSLIEERIKPEDKDKFASLIISDYYEIIKELMTALLLIEWYKTLSHVDLINYFKANYKEINIQEIILVDKLRVLRNRIAYEGFKIGDDYLKDNEFNFLQIIKKLKCLIKKKLGVKNI